MIFDAIQSIIIGVTYFSTYFIPPLMYELNRTCKNYFSVTLLCMISYILCLPLYLIVIQIYSYANWHDVSWGNREVSADLDIQ